MLPFTTQQFLDVLARYNEAVWPAQVAMYVLAAITLFLVAREHRSAAPATLSMLALMWLVNGAGYHIGFFSRINPAALAFGLIFTIQAILLAGVAIAGRRVEVVMRKDGATAVALALVLYALLGYPLFGAMLGHVYPALPVVGLAPCPTTILTLGMLLLAGRSAPGWLYVIPLGSVAFGSAAFLFGMFEDIGLVVAGIAAAYFLATRRRAAAPIAGHPA